MSDLGIGIIGSGYMGRTFAECLRNYCKGGKLRAVGRQPAPEAEPATDTEATVLGLLTRSGRAGHRLEGDRAFTGREHGNEFVKWFDATTVEPADLWTHVGTVPRSRIYEVADEARRRAGFWSNFADSLEGQLRRRA